MSKGRLDNQIVLDDTESGCVLNWLLAHVCGQLGLYTSRKLMVSGHWGKLVDVPVVDRQTDQVGLICIFYGFPGQLPIVDQGKRPGSRRLVGQLVSRRHRRSEAVSWSPIHVCFNTAYQCSNSSNGNRSVRKRAIVISSKSTLELAGTTRMLHEYYNSILHVNFPSSSSDSARFVWFGGIPFSWWHNETATYNFARLLVSKNY